MNVLILEDDAHISFTLGGFLEDNDIVVYKAMDLLRAEEILQELHIDFVLIDLNMSPQGLDEDLIVSTQEGAITGWIWCKTYLIPRHPNLRSKIILFSAYLDELEIYVDVEELSDVTRIRKEITDQDKYQLILRKILTNA